jgi:hypothetical protein
LQAGVAIIMRYRGLDREFPFFFTYTILQVVSEAVLITMERLSYKVYFYSYWIDAALCVLISFALMDELFKSAFRQFEAISKLGEIVFRWAVVVVLLAAAGDILASRHIRQPGLSEGILVADRSARAMLCALVTLLLLGSRYLGISRRDLRFGISLGFSIFTLTKVILDSVALRWPPPYVVLGRLNSIVYIFACVIWLAYVVLAAQRPAFEAGPSAKFDPVLPTGDTSQATTVELLNDAVERAMRRWSAASKD